MNIRFTFKTDEQRRQSKKQLPSKWSIAASIHN